MAIKMFHFSKGESNHHGTQKKGEPWNQQTVTGPKLVFLDLIAANTPRMKDSQLIFYWRIIYYFKNGACWYFDIAIPRVPRPISEAHNGER
jgi:hypothetical protein